MDWVGFFRIITGVGSICTVRDSSVRFFQYLFVYYYAAAVKRFTNVVSYKDVK